MRLRIHGDKAHARMLGLSDARFQDGLLHYWVVRPDGTVAPHSLLWLFCWAETGWRSVAAMEDCRRFWNDFTGVPFATLDSSEFHAYALDGRYKTRLNDASLLAEMRRVAASDLDFLADGSSAPFPAPPALTASRAPASSSAPVRSVAPAARRASARPPDQSAPTSAPAETKPVLPMPHAVVAAPESAGRLPVSEMERLHAICRTSDDRIWQAQRASAGTSAPPASGLVFPSYTSRPGLRISEQEARMLFCQQVEASGAFSYSVETPTEGRYAWAAGPGPAAAPTGTKGMSARLDVTLYRRDSSRALNVEFKAGGAGTSLGPAAEQDLVKLLVEPCDGMWFGVLESATERTLRAILESLWATVTRVIAEGSVAASLPMTLVFHLVVLAPSFSIHRAVSVAPAVSGRLLSVAEFAAVPFPAGAPGASASERTGPDGWTRRFAAAG